MIYFTPLLVSSFSENAASTLLNWMRAKVNNCAKKSSSFLSNLGKVCSGTLGIHAYIMAYCTCTCICTCNYVNLLALVNIHLNFNRIK